MRGARVLHARAPRAPRGPSVCLANLGVTEVSGRGRAQQACLAGLPRAGRWTVMGAGVRSEKDADGHPGPRKPLQHTLTGRRMMTASPVVWWKLHRTKLRGSPPAGPSPV